MAIDIFAKFATDESLETNGTWRDLGGGTRVLVARSGNRAYARMLAKLYEQHRAVLDAADDVADRKSDQIMAEVVAKTILLGWESVLYKGKHLEYSVENATMLLAHKDFRRTIMNLAEDQEAYLAKEEIAQGEA